MSDSHFPHPGRKIRQARSPRRSLASSPQSATSTPSTVFTGRAPDATTPLSAASQPSASGQAQSTLFPLTAAPVVQPVLFGSQATASPLPPQQTSLFFGSTDTSEALDRTSTIARSEANSGRLFARASSGHFNSTPSSAAADNPFAFLSPTASPNTGQRRVSGGRFTSSNPAPAAAASAPPIFGTPSAPSPSQPAPTLFPISSQAFTFGSSPDPTENETDRLAAGLGGLRLGSSSPAPAQSVTQQTTAPPDERKTDMSAVYDVGSEAAPNHPLFLPSFQKSLQFGNELARGAIQAMQQVPAQFWDQSLQSLLKDAQRLSVFRPTVAKKIATLGDSGEGKSSLINSLLHMPSLANTSDAGSACTSVVTEYWQKSAVQTAPISIEVEYLSPEGIADMIRELLWSYRRLYRPGIDSPETPADEYQKAERESGEAWSALEAAFKHHSGFNEQSLRDQSEGAAEKILEQLVAWSRAISWPEESDRGKWTATAQTALECSEKTAIFMSDQHWPFTKVLRIYVDAVVLKAGVVLVDLPGLQDANLARVKVTQDYLMKCDSIFIVSKISRAITDQSLKSSLYSVLARNMPSQWNEQGEEQSRERLNLSVVCTKSEDIDLDSARAKFCGPGKAVTLNQVNMLDEEIKQAKTSNDQALKRKLKYQRQILFMEARNCHVQAGLRKAHAAKIPGGKLEVFCVSNRLYEKESGKGDIDLLTASGIPQLRSFCRLIAADAQLQEAKHFLQSSLYSLVNSLQLWATKVDTEKEDCSVSQHSKELIFSRLQDTEDGTMKEATKLVAELKDSFKEQIAKFSDHRRSFWADAARDEAKKWAEWNNSQYNAWCHRNGSHSTLSRPHQDWNADIIWKMRTELAWQWDILVDDVPDAFQRLLDQVDRLVASLQEILAAASFRPITYSLLKGGTELRAQIFRHCAKLLQDRTVAEIKLSRRYASETNHTSYILQQMIPSYRHASNQYGPGRWARQKAIVGGRVGDDALFRSICKSMQDRHRSIMEMTRIQLHDLVSELMVKLRLDVDSAVVSAAQVEQGPVAKNVQNMKDALTELMETATWLRQEATA